ncbi:hypothetical protein J2S50_006738 [Streptomyces sp. DSM 40167]|nr:hypothetical protein [Streptomyces sp. DSM 40167]
MFASPTTDRHGRPNYARYHFLDDTSHVFFIDWDSGAAATVALLRAEAGREPHDRPLRELIGELSTLSQDFRTLWAAHDVRIRHDGVKRLQHPDVGELELTYQSVDLPVSQRAVHDLSLYTAGPGGTSEGRLKLLAGLAATRTPTAKPTDQRRSGPAVRPDAVATCASHSATVAGLVPSRSAMS